MIITKGLTFKYNSEQIFEFPDIELKEQENLLILGKSGIGKTTLLHLLAGFLTPKSGNVVINKTTINLLSQSKLDAFRGQNIGIVFQKNLAVKSLSVCNNLKARLLFSKKEINNAKVDKVLNQLNIKTCKNKEVNKLSVGQLQRLGIALAVIHYPKLILADEPTSSLDDENCKAVIKLLINQAKQTKANLIVITHDHRIQSYFKNSVSL